MKATRILPFFLMSLQLTSANDLIFQDTFDTADTTQLNSDLAARQSSGLVISEYSAGNNFGSITDNQYTRTTDNSGKFSLQEDFAAYLTGRIYEITFTLRCTSDVQKWFGISLTNATHDSTSTSPVSILIRDNDTIWLNTGSQNNDGAYQRDLQTISQFDTNVAHDYLIRLYDRGMDSSIQLLIDGEEVQLDHPNVSFYDNDARRLEFNSSGAAVVMDNLQIKRLRNDEPNVVIILTDDHGYTDLGAYGIDPNVQTPHMDSLALNGALFTRGYTTAPQCRPARAGLLAGILQNRLGVLNNGEPGLPDSALTVAERISSLGYVTGFSGKFDADDTQTLTGAWENGFDDYFDLTLDSGWRNFDFDGNDLSHSSYSLDTMSGEKDRVEYQGEAAVTFINRRKEEPFFLYFSPYGPHVPMIDTRHDAYENFPAVDYPNFSNELDDWRRRGLAHIKLIDDQVGALIDTLRKHGLEENTLILFASDNGAPVGTDIENLANLSKWDGSLNIPRRGEKGNIHEGGINIPMFAYWKGVIPAGQVINEAISTLDFTPTALKVAGISQLPTELDGVDILPLLTGDVDSLSRTKPLFIHWGRNYVLLKNGYKFYGHDIPSRDMLFHLPSDPNELTDLKFTEPTIFADMRAEATSLYLELPDDARRGPQFWGDNNTGNDFYVGGAAPSAAVDPLYSAALGLSTDIGYPAAVITTDAPTGYKVDTDGDGRYDSEEILIGRLPDSPLDLGAEFNEAMNYEGWSGDNARMRNTVVEGGYLTGETTDREVRYDGFAYISPNNGVDFETTSIRSIVLRLKSAQTGNLKFRFWKSSDSTTLTLPISTADEWANYEFVLDSNSLWTDGNPVTDLRFEVNWGSGSNALSIDWIRTSDGDLDNDLLPDTYEQDTLGFDYTDSTDGNADGDGDGHSYGLEYLAGTSDNDSNDKLTLTLTTTEPEFSIDFSGRAERGYKVYRSVSLASNSWVEIYNTGILNTETPVNLPIETSTDRAFFLIEPYLSGVN